MTITPLCGAVHNGYRCASPAGHQGHHRGQHATGQAWTAWPAEPHMPPCAHCGKDRWHNAGRGLCSSCYARLRKSGDLADYPRLAAAPETDIVKVTGATYRQIDYWARMGYLEPEHDGGIGVPRQWPSIEVDVARKMARLIRIGITPALANRIARGQCDLGNGIRIEIT